MNRPVPGPVTCKRCQSTLRFVRMDRSNKVMPVTPVPDATGNVAARKVGTRYVAGYVLRHGEVAKPGYTTFRGHFLDCPPEAPKHARSEATPLF